MWDIRPQCLFSTDDGLEQSSELHPIVRPMSESSVVMVLLHVVFGRPLLRFPVGVHLRATFGIESCGIRRTWPNHLNLCFCIWVLIGDEFVLLYRSSLDILFGQNMLQVLRRTLGLEYIELIHIIFGDSPALTSI